MKKIYTIIIVTILTAIISLFPAYAEDSVSALEYAEESVATEDTSSPDSASLVPESYVMDTEAVQDIPEEAESAENPDTGVRIAIIPAVAALAVLAVLQIIKNRK